MKNTSKILALVLIVMTVFTSLSLITASAADVEYYLIGWINNADVNDESYPFVDGKVTVELTSDSYVNVKDSNGNTYWTNGWLGTSGITETVLKTQNEQKNDKLYVPKGTVTLTIVVNGDGSLTLSFAEASDCAHNIVDATCTKAAYCTLCGVVRGTPAFHAYNGDSICDTCGFDVSVSHTVYLTNEANWTTVNVYCWNKETDQNAAPWPGTPIQAVDGVYSVEIPAGYDMIIFNDGTNQTADLVLPNDADTFNNVTNLWTNEHNVGGGDVDNTPDDNGTNNGTNNGENTNKPGSDLTPEPEVENDFFAAIIEWFMDLIDMIVEFFESLM